MRYCCRLRGDFEIVTAQKILFGKGYLWSSSGDSIITIFSKELYIRIFVNTKKLYIAFRMMDTEITFEEFLDKVESDEI
jgi:hypothetical protein